MSEHVQPSEREEHLKLKRLLSSERLEEIDFTDKVMNQVYNCPSFNMKKRSILQPLRSFKGIALAVIIIGLIGSSAYAAYEKSISLKDKDGNVLLSILPWSGEPLEGVDPAYSEIMNTYRASLQPGESMSFIFSSKEDALKNKSLRTYSLEIPYKIADIGSNPKINVSPLADQLFPGKKISKYTYEHALIFNKKDKLYMNNGRPELLDAFKFTINENGIEYGYRMNPIQDEISSIQLKYASGKEEIIYSIAVTEPFASPLGKSVMYVHGPMGSLHNLKDTEVYYSESDTSTYKSIYWTQKLDYRNYNHRISSAQASKKELLDFAEEIVGK